MAETAASEIQAYIEELRGRARESQQEAERELNPLFKERDQGRPPRNFVESSFLYMRSCDADLGSRPLPCSLFWLSPDLRVAPLSRLGTPTRDLIAGAAYRITATVRNRGDLPVPSAKVEFYLADPTLGWDIRYATKLGVAAARVQAHGASEVSLDYTVPPALSGHRCLFARVFSFSPLDLPIDDFALNPLVDRHVAQLNLNIVAQASSLTVSWLHLRNAAERLAIEPMSAGVVHALRLETVTGLTLVGAERWKEFAGGLEIDFEPGKGPVIEASRTEFGLELTSRDEEAIPVERQAELTDRVLATLRAQEAGRREDAKARELFKEFRAMTVHTVRSEVTLRLPDVGLEPDEAVGLNLVKRDVASGEATGGIGLFVVGERR